jgi:PIN domain nuclease of toxin-antitoxin system
MRVLLDTHAFMWFVQGADRLSKVARGAIEEAEPLLSVDAVFDAYGVNRIW